MTVEPLRIALMSSQKQWGGGEHLLHLLGQGLEARGHHVLWIAPRNSQLLRRLERSSDCVHTLSGRRPTPWAMYHLRQRMKRDNIEVLHLNDSHATTWGAMLSLGRRRLVRVGVKHTVFEVRSAVKYNWFLDRLVCVSRASEQVCLNAGIARDKLRVIYGGVDNQKFDRLAERQFIAEELGLPADRTYLSSVGSLIPCKGHYQLIEAIDHLRQLEKDVCLVICGEGPERPRLEQLIQERNLQGHVRLVGFQPETARWIAGSDLYVHASHSEGLSLVAIQSQFVGTPVVAMDVGGLSEVMRAGSVGEALGWLTKDGKPETLCRLMFAALNDTQARQRFVRLAQREAVERFSLDAMIGNFEQEYLFQIARKNRHLDSRLGTEKSGRQSTFGKRAA